MGLCILWVPASFWINLFRSCQSCRQAGSVGLKRDSHCEQDVFLNIKPFGACFDPSCLTVQWVHTFLNGCRTETCELHWKKEPPNLALLVGNQTENSPAVKQYRLRSLHRTKQGKHNDRFYPHLQVVVFSLWAICMNLVRIFCWNGLSLVFSATNYSLTWILWAHGQAKYVFKGIIWHFWEIPLSPCQ